MSKNLDNMTQAEWNAYMDTGLKCLEIMVPAINAMRQEGATTDRIIRVLEGVIAELKGPTPEELADGEILVLKFAEVFSEYGVPIIDGKSGLEVSTSKH